MKLMALIENGVIENLIVTDDNGWPGGIDVTGLEPAPGIGWYYDADSGSFTAPIQPDPVLPDAPAPEPLPPNRIITNLAFDLRFTTTERIAIDLASIDDPTAPEETRIQAAVLRVAQERSKKAMFTDLDDPITRQDELHMEQVGLIDEGQAARRRFWMRRCWTKSGHDTGQTLSVKSLDRPGSTGQHPVRRRPG